MLNDKIRLLCVFPVLLLAAVGGCKRSAAPPVDSDRARETLKTTLNAWQKGDTVQSLQDRSSITVADPMWKKGHRLIRYEIAGDERVIGGDLHCHVLLIMKSPNGQDIEEKAVFAVSTAPALVVVRAEG